jgi:hypothetical protein
MKDHINPRNNTPSSLIAQQHYDIIMKVRFFKTRNLETSCFYARTFVLTLEQTATVERKAGPNMIRVNTHDSTSF